MRRISRFLKFGIFALAFIAVFSFVVMLLWNWLMPTLFAWHPITFWQAVGVLVLSKILFGGFRGHQGAPWHWRRRLFERWEQMTPDEREKFRQGLQSRPGSTRAPE